MPAIDSISHNQLQFSRSAYLRSAAHQPIAWMEFSDEAFAKAKAEDKPILLDIGAVWCHWCHVIDRESYENEEIAALINAHFIPVKVDRDQRPDVDARYQQLVVSLTGHGGWPLTGFLTYEGQLIYGGTYFPPHVMKNLLQKIHQTYHEKKADVFHQAAHLEAHLKSVFQDSADLGAFIENNEQQTHSLKTESSAFLNAILDSCHQAYDADYPGFGTQPKFPHFSTIMLLLNFDSPHNNMAYAVLNAMKAGGVYDQLAGGFHRYSVDRHWHVPHFEKMAYDNAEAIQVYTQAYLSTDNSADKKNYARTVSQSVEWVLRDLCDLSAGGFFASQDADIDLEDDGDHFTWTLSEIKQLESDNVLPAELARWTVLYFGLHDAGDMHERLGRCVLKQAKTLTQMAEHFCVSQEEAEKKIDTITQILLSARKKRPIPFIDSSLYTHWNGMLITAITQAAVVFERPDWLSISQKSLDRILDAHLKRADLNLNELQVLHSPGVPAFLEDVAFLLQACLTMYQATLKPCYLEEAKHLGDYLIAQFEDSAAGGFFDIAQSSKTSDTLGLLRISRKPSNDTPSSSANGIALQGLNDLFWLTQDSQYQASVEKGLGYFLKINSKPSLYHSALGVALHQWLNPPWVLHVANSTDSSTPFAEVIEKCQRSANSRAASRLLLLETSGTKPSSPTSDRATVQICRGTQCYQQTEDPEVLKAFLVENQLISLITS
ncbi:MAG: thioredoxin domain-containing protein [Cyanobacteria bacterium]|nr:thioredoxin domain-containing protein [Cyanobacteriota bacterium]